MSIQEIENKVRELRQLQALIEEAQAEAPGAIPGAPRSPVSHSGRGPWFILLGPRTR